MSDLFFKNLSQSINHLIEKALTPESSISHFLRRRRTVGLSDLLSPDDRIDIQVIPILPYTLHSQQAESDLLKFQKTEEPETILVFRPPVLVTFAFIIACPKTDLMTKLSDLDKLSLYFFNHRTIEPFLPKSLEIAPEIYQRILQSRAHLKPIPISTHAERVPGAIFSFEYTSLFHSGKPLREERLVQKRTIEWVNGTHPSNLKRES
jgi:hypothetical protein